MTALKKITNSEVAILISSIKTFIFDCDGVLWNSYGIIPGAVQLIKKLKEKNKQLFFVTNNSSSSRKTYLKKFQNYGIDIEAHEILSTAYIAARYIKEILKLKKIYMIGSQGMAAEFDEEGIKYVGLGPQPPASESERHYALNFDTTVDSEVKAVVVGWDPDFNLNKISQAMQYLKNKEIPFIATNKDPSFSVGNGIFTPGTGCIVKAVEIATSRKAKVLGKPNKELFEIASTIAEIDPNTTLMIGDRLDTDIMFGKNCSLKTLCVLSGITQSHHLEELKKNDSAENYPDFVADSVQDFCDGIETN